MTPSRAQVGMWVDHMSGQGDCGTLGGSGDEPQPSGGAQGVEVELVGMAGAMIPLGNLSIPAVWTALATWALALGKGGS